MLVQVSTFLYLPSPSLSLSLFFILYTIHIYVQVMHQRVPMFPFQTLTHWYELGTPANRYIYTATRIVDIDCHQIRMFKSKKLFYLRAEVVEYYLLRCHGNYQLLEKLNVIGRTSEFARLYGIEFENVLTRGTQV